MYVDTPAVVAAAIGVLTVGAVLAINIHADRQHEAFLKSHGCQLLTKAPTGRQVYCGKACSRDEHVYVYECADGLRTEVH